jgi:putative ABC transport system permease protein
MNPTPGKSHLNYDVYASYSSVPGMEKNNKLPRRTEDWSSFNASYTYVLLKKGSTAAAIDDELKTVSAELNRINDDGISGFNAQAISKITPAKKD